MFDWTNCLSGNLLTALSARAALRRFFRASGNAFNPFNRGRY